MTARADQAGAGVRAAVQHALGWLVVGNATGLWLALLLLFPRLQTGVWSYGRWVPVHLNVQLFGWTSLPLVAWLLHIYEVDRSKAAAWAGAAVWAWTTALACGVLAWLGGDTSGKVFLDWQGGVLWGLVVAMVALWMVLALACRERSAGWSPVRRRLSRWGLVMLGVVPAAMVYAASPRVYPAVDVTTGGPTGASLLGSTLVVVTLMMLLPRAGVARGAGLAEAGSWTYLGFCWLAFAAAEWAGGTHHDPVQLAAMALLLPWAWLIPRDWCGFEWPAGGREWRFGLFLWWALLVGSGVVMYVPGVLDRLKFTQGLVAHSHLAMAGFTTSFCALLVVSLGGGRMAVRGAVLAWHGAALVMVLVLLLMGWCEGADYAWMLGNPWWRTLGWVVRACSGTVMLGISFAWWIQTERR